MHLILTWVSLGSIGSITSAVTVAASSFNMSVTDPADLLAEIDQVYLERLLNKRNPSSKSGSVDYREPGQKGVTAFLVAPDDSLPIEVYTPNNAAKESTSLVEDHQAPSVENNLIVAGKVQRLGDFIDTDALAPAEALTGSDLSPKALGKYCLYHTHPEFRSRVAEEGMDIVVAGKAFGVGSSRENAVTALQGAGVKCVIAKSFAFIYARNQPNLGMLGVIIEDEDFYAEAEDGTDISIDVDKRKITLCGKEYHFTLSELEIQLWQQGGMAKAFGKWGKNILEEMVAPKPASISLSLEQTSEKEFLAW